MSVLGACPGGVATSHRAGEAGETDDDGGTEGAAKAAGGDMARAEGPGTGKCASVASVRALYRSPAEMDARSRAMAPGAFTASCRAVVALEVSAATRAGTETGADGVPEAVAAPVVIDSAGPWVGVGVPVVEGTVRASACAASVSRVDCRRAFNAPVVFPDSVAVEL